MVQAGEIFFDDNHDNSPETEFAWNIKEGVVVTEDNSNDEREPKILARFWQLEQIEKAQKDGGQWGQSVDIVSFDGLEEYMQHQDELKVNLMKYAIGRMF